MAQIGSEIEHNEAFRQNAESFLSLQQSLEADAARIRLGGGSDAIASHHGRGKLTARERIERLIDSESYLLEIGLFAAFGMYEEYGGAPSSGTVFGIGRIGGRDMVIVANDAAVKSGAWFPITCKKNLRAQEIALGADFVKTSTGFSKGGATVEMKPGDVFYVPPHPHDSWVVGDEPYVSLHFLGADHYAKK